MARLDCGLHLPAALPLDLLSDTENGQKESRVKTADLVIKLLKQGLNSWITGFILKCSCDMCINVFEQRDSCECDY